MALTQQPKTGEVFLMREPLPGRSIPTTHDERKERQREQGQQYNWRRLKETIETLGGEVICDAVKRPIDKTERHAMYPRDPGLVLHDGAERYYSIGTHPSHMGLKEPAAIARMIKPHDVALGKPIAGVMDGGNAVPHQASKTLFVGVNNYFMLQEYGHGVAPHRLQPHKHVDPAWRKELFRDRMTDAKPTRLWLDEAKARHEKASQGRAGMPYRIVPLFMKDSYAGDFYHLDGAFNLLPNGKGVVCRDVFGKAALHRIDKEMGRENLFEISEEDALKGATNFITVGSHVVTPHAPAELRLWFEQQGYSVVTPKDVAPHMAAGAWKFEAGAGPRCATLKLTEDMGYPQPQATASLQR